MAFTQNDLTNIDAAIASGEMSVEVNGRKIAYKSVADLMQARSMIAASIASDAMAASSDTRRGAFAVRFKTARE
jgi:uncharacterized Zn-binding protein involved in type VI secretion